MPRELSKRDILRLFEALNDELRGVNVKGQLNLAGGAVMCVALDARPSTRDVDASFHPSVAVLDAAHRVAAKLGVPDFWLNDAVKAYMSDRGTFTPLLERSHLKVFCATPEYMLAMKCLAMRTGEAYHDEEDVRYLLRHLGLRRYEDAEAILARYYPLAEYPGAALSAVRELLPRG
jgi:hypothetical protein